MYQYCAVSQVLVVPDDKQLHHSSTEVEGGKKDLETESKHYLY